MIPTDSPRNDALHSSSSSHSDTDIYHPRDDSSSAAYHSIASDVDTDACNAPTIRLDKDGYEDVRLRDPSPLSATAREGIGSRLLSSLSSTGSPPAAAALQRSGSALHSRARSWAAFVPKLTTSNSFSSDKTSQSQRQSKIFGDLFAGESAPVHLGVPASFAQEQDEDFVMDYRPSLTERPRMSHQRKVSTASTIGAKETKSSSWFGRKSTTSTPAPTVDPRDEILNMNIHASLFPHGPADPLSPQAFNDLLLNATSLLQRVQEEYKKKVEFISNIQPEIEAQKEEVEEAETRAAHLKLQLEDIGRQYQEQKQVNEEVVFQLSMEKMKLQEARESAKSVRLVRRGTEDTEAGGADDEAYRRQRKRGSAGSASDSGFESDADTSSVFSGGMETPSSARQPQFSLTHADLDANATPVSRDLPFFPRGSGVLSQRSGPQGQMGGGEAAAWATCESLRRENAMLGAQMEEMRQSLQGCIDFVGGVTA